MSPTSVLVTGADGFVGRSLLRALRYEAPVRITAASGPGSAGAGPSEPLHRPRGAAGRQAGATIETVTLDVRDPARVRDLIAQLRPHHVYHLAARASAADCRADAVFAVNVGGSRNVLEAAASLRRPPRVLLVSSGYVYGETEPRRPAQEGDPLALPGQYGPYADSKIAMEALAAEYGGFVLVARAFAHTGAGQRDTFALPSFARQIARIEASLQHPVVHTGNLDVLRDILDVRDVVRAYVRIMIAGRPGAVYNVSVGHPVTMRNALQTLRSLSPIECEVRVDTARMRSTDIRCSTGDPSRIGSELGWTARIGLAETLRDLLEFWRRMPADAQPV